MFHLKIRCIQWFDEPYHVKVSQSLAYIYYFCRYYYYYSFIYAAITLVVQTSI
jgi:hypothetical protein